MIIQSRKFTPAQRWPAGVKLNYREGVYTIDSAKSEVDLPEKNILLWLVSRLVHISVVYAHTCVGYNP